MDRCHTEMLLSRLLDGELTEQEQLRLDAHLRECVRCRELLSDLKAVEEQLHAVPLPSSADWQSRWRTVAEALSPPRPTVLGRVFAGRLRITIAAAACVLAVLVGLWTLRSMHTEVLPAWSATELASAGSLEVEIEQVEGAPEALFLVSGSGDTAVVWVADVQGAEAVPGI